MNAEQIARALGGKRSGRQWLCKCPAHEDHSPSMIVFDGHDAVQVRCLSGCAPRDIIVALRIRGLWEAHRSDVAAGVTSLNEEINRNHQRALRIWQEALDPRSSAAELYLIGRNLVLPETTCIRFHPQCPHERKVSPALVALMHDVESGQPQAIQRLLLDAGNRKVEAKMLGPAGRAAMMLTSREDTFNEELGYCSRLFVCEGLETGIALWMQGYRPVWALGSAGAIARFPVLFAVGEIVICADNDANGTGLNAAFDCRERWIKEQGKRVRIWMPKDIGYDFADGVGGSHGGETTTG